MHCESIYFIGIGGIGMSNLARYFLSRGKRVGGYDRTESPLTRALQDEGALVRYEDNAASLPAPFLDRDTTLVVYTPAVPDTHGELRFFRENGYTLMKRAQLLGQITAASDAVCVAGTHGKTTVSSMIAHLLRQSPVDCNAFLGGILRNCNTNLLLSPTSHLTVVEADEYDRSFHWLKPRIAVITSADPDHLDIYGTATAYRQSFETFTTLIRPGGHLIVKRGIALTPRCDASVKVWSYGETEGDFHAGNIRMCDGEILFDLHTPAHGTIHHISPGVPARINVENATAAAAAALLCGVAPAFVRPALQTFGGVARRFEFHLRTARIVLIDDYAHHPRELSATLRSVRTLYPGRKITAIFQPHLYSRTRDFAEAFARSLTLADEVILLDIYPAREEPIPGVTSRIIFDRIHATRKTLCTAQQLPRLLRERETEVLITLGAGDIDRLLPTLKRVLSEKYLAPDTPGFTDR